LTDKNPSAHIRLPAWFFIKKIFFTIRVWMFSGKYSEEEAEALLKNYIANSIVLSKTCIRQPNVYPVTGGMRFAQGWAFSSCAAKRKSVASSP